MKFEVFKSTGIINGTYGIRAVENNKVITWVDDISSDEKFVRSLSELFNKHKLSAIHLKDAVEDFIVK